MTSFIALAPALVGCGGAQANDQLVVFGAASLTDALVEIGETFAVDNPGVVVEFNFAGSPTLREQLREGAPADIVITANQEIMHDLESEGLVIQPVPAIANRMIVVMPEGNPGGVERLRDLGNPGLLVGLCDATVPCGITARSILKAAGIIASPDTNETDVRALLAKVSSGELDAGIVYATDVLNATPGVETLAIDPALYEPNVYPIAVTSSSGDQFGAKDFVEYVLSENGQQVFAKYGFLPLSEIES